MDRASRTPVLVISLVCLGCAGEWSDARALDEVADLFRCAFRCDTNGVVCQRVHDASGTSHLIDGSAGQAAAVLPRLDP